MIVMIIIIIIPIIIVLNVEVSLFGVYIFRKFCGWLFALSYTQKKIFIEKIKNFNSSGNLLSNVSNLCVCVCVT